MCNFAMQFLHIRDAKLALQQSIIPGYDFYMEGKQTGKGNKMQEIINCPVWQLVFDITANGGWNGVAIMTWALIIGMVLGAICEAKKGN